MRLRQIALVGEDLAKNAADIEAVLGLGHPYADPGVGHYGLVNAVWPVGDTFLEVVSPEQEGTTAGRLLDKRGGDGGYMAIFQVDDIEVARQRVAEAGVRIVSQADRDGVHMSHLHPRDIGGAIVSIDEMTPKDRWEWGGPGWRDQVRVDVSTKILGCELQADDPEAMSKRWAEVLGLPRERSKAAWVLRLDDGGEVRFATPRDGRGEGLSAFDVGVHNPDLVRKRAAERGLLASDGHVVLCGARVNLVQV